MENEQKIKKTKWRLNLFDIIFIICAVVAVVVLLWLSSRSSGNAGVLSQGTPETISYTIELQGILDESATMIKPGDTLVDKVERRTLGTIANVSFAPARASQKNQITGERIVSDLLGRTDVTVTMSAQANVTETRITVDGYTVRVGTLVSVTGPGYSGAGFIISIVRND